MTETPSREGRESAEAGGLERELLEMCRRLISTNETAAARMVEVLRFLARDILAVADLAAPSDALEEAQVRHCRARAQRLLRGLGDDRNAN